MAMRLVAVCQSFRISAASPFAYDRPAFSIDFFAAREVPVSAAARHIGEMTSGYSASPSPSACSSGNSGVAWAPLAYLLSRRDRLRSIAKEELEMTILSNIFAFVMAFATIAGLAFLSGSPAEARGKEVFVQTYQFSKPMHGYSGRSGNYYCDYQRLPNRKCFVNANGHESCKIVSWTLREMCQ
jgi:hypothetical protein